jgi:hypothetical protein
MLFTTVDAQFALSTVENYITTEEGSMSTILSIFFIGIDYHGIKIIE